MFMVSTPGVKGLPSGKRTKLQPGVYIGLRRTLRSRYISDVTVTLTHASGFQSRGPKWRYPRSDTRMQQEIESYKASFRVADSE